MTDSAKYTQVNTFSKFTFKLRFSKLIMLCGQQFPIKMPLIFLLKVCMANYRPNVGTIIPRSRHHLKTKYIWYLMMHTFDKSIRHNFVSLALKENYDVQVFAYPKKCIMREQRCQVFASLVSHDGGILVLWYQKMPKNLAYRRQ